MFYRCEDAALDWDLYCADQEEDLKRYPKCCMCGNPITDDYLYEIDGEMYCEDCMEDTFRVDTEDRMVG